MPHYIITVAPRLEFRAAIMLNQIGKCTVPLIHKLVRENSKSDTKVVRAAPLIPRYIMINMMVPDFPTLRNVTYPNGDVVVKGILGDVHGPKALSSFDELIIRRMCKMERAVVSPQRGLSVGDAVIIQSGPHAGKRVRVERIKNGSDITYLQEMFGGMREWTVEARKVQKVA